MATDREIIDEYARTGSVHRTAANLHAGKDRVRRVVRNPDRTVPGKTYTLTASLPEPDQLAGGPTLPDPICARLESCKVSGPGWWLALGDTHLPMHDKATIMAAVDEARAKNAAGVLLNGDIMDMFSISPFFRPPTRDRFVDEIAATRQFLGWLRSRLPRARIIYRQGNHEFRLNRYIADRAAMLYDLEEIQLPGLLHLKDYGVEWVQDKRKVMLGKLTTLHGHELRRGEGVNPARFVFLRTTSTALTGHFHRSSVHHQRTLADEHIACWTVGCACYIHPDYDPYNQWNHGYAMVELANDDWFSVHNRQLIDGRVV